MKKLIGMVIASLLFSNIGFAEIRITDSKTIKDGRWVGYSIATFCVDGYKFVAAADTDANKTIGFVQFYEQVHGKPGSASQPAYC